MPSGRFNKNKQVEINVSLVIVPSTVIAYVTIDHLNSIYQSFHDNRTNLRLKFQCANRVWVGFQRAEKDMKTSKG